MFASTIDLNQTSSIAARSLGTGNAGNISIHAAERFILANGRVTTEALQGDGGNIEIHVGRLLHLRDSEITTSVGSGGGNGGNITIDPDVVILDRSHITANAFGGAGGNIRITAGIFLIDPDSAITASSELGVPGTIDIQVVVPNLSGTLAPLPQNFLNVGALLASRCATRVAGESTSSFVVAGRDGIPEEPGGLLPSPVSPTAAMSVASAKSTSVETSGVESGTLLALNTWGQDLNSGCVQ